MKKLFLFSLTVFCFFLCSCGEESGSENVGSKDGQTDITNGVDSTQETDSEDSEHDFSAAGKECETSEECSGDAGFCMPEDIRPMPNFGPVNALRCTSLDCDPDDSSTCPENYVCFPLTMKAEYFPTGTKSVCFRNPDKQ